MPDLEETLRQLKQRTRAAMRRRRMARPGTEAYRRADERVHDLNEMMSQIRMLLERRRRFTAFGSAGSRG
jgi:hypothetical protein